MLPKINSHLIETTNSSICRSIAKKSNGLCVNRILSVRESCIDIIATTRSWTSNPSTLCRISNSRLLPEVAHVIQVLQFLGRRIIKRIHEDVPGTRRCPQVYGVYDLQRLGIR